MACAEPLPGSFFICPRFMLLLSVPCSGSGEDRRYSYRYTPVLGSTPARATNCKTTRTRPTVST
uniref:RxLR effector candidate protein n=1 Tax=Hyaloperonospora arabidopsidis (strain Emoy2) TaxID=559515 RepID=M4BTG0_HYAAE